MRRFWQCKNPSPRRALPLLWEVPSAHTGERGLRGGLRCRREKTGRSADNSFPHWQSLSHGDPSVSLALDSSPKRGAKGGDGSRRADLYFFRNEPCRNRRNRLPNLRHSEEGEARRGNPFSFTPHQDYTHSQGNADCHVATLLAMTVVAVSRRTVFNTTPRPAGRCPF